MSEQKVLRALVSALICAIWLSAVAAPAAAKPLSPADQRFLQSLEGLESRDVTPRAAAANCLLYFGGTEDPEVLRQVVVGFLAVPETEAIPAFCSALVEAIASRWLASAAVRDAMADPSGESGAAGLGSILRQVFYAHVRGASHLAHDGQRP